LDEICWNVSCGDSREGLAAGRQEYLHVLAVSHDSRGRAADGQVFRGGQRGGLGMSFGQWSGGGWRRGEARFFWAGWVEGFLSQPWGWWGT